MISHLRSYLRCVSKGRADAQQNLMVHQPRQSFIDAPKALLSLLALSAQHTVDSMREALQAPFTGSEKRAKSPGARSEQMGRCLVTASSFCN